jgi:flagellar FliL protein
MAKAPAEKPKAETPDEDAEQSGAPPKKDKKKLIMLIAIGVVLLLVSVGGTFAVIKFLGHGSKKEAVAEGGETAEKGEEDAEAKEGEEHAGSGKAELSYMPLEPAFLANFSVNGRQHYLQLSITLTSRDKDTMEALQKHMPLVRNRIVLLLSGEQFDVLRTRAGREALQTKLQDSVKEILQKESGKSAIEKVLFTNFVMQ